MHSYISLSIHIRFSCFRSLYSNIEVTIRDIIASSVDFHGPGSRRCAIIGVLWGVSEGSASSALTMYVHMCMYVCVYIYIYIYVYMYLSLHMYIYIYM